MKSPSDGLGHEEHFSTHNLTQRESACNGGRTRRASKEQWLVRLGSNRHTGSSDECPLWVRSGHHKTLDRCPLYPRKRTSVERDCHVRFVPEADMCSAQLVSAKGQ